MNNSIENLKFKTQKFIDTKNELNKLLDLLTSDQAGYLYELKRVMGPETDIGITISHIDEKIIEAKTKVLKAYNDIAKELENRAIQAQNIAINSNSELININQNINSIDFRTFN